VWKALSRQGVPPPRCRVERLMRRHGLRGAQPGHKRRWLTVADDAARMSRSPWNFATAIL
jgi:putative transposase